MLSRFIQFIRGEMARHEPSPPPAPAPVPKPAPAPTPKEPGPSDGDTRIEVIEYGDGRVVYTAQSCVVIDHCGVVAWERLASRLTNPYSQREDRTSLFGERWNRDYPEESRPARDTEAYAKALIDCYLAHVKAGSVVKRTYIKYP